MVDDMCYKSVSGAQVLISIFSWLGYGPNQMIVKSTQKTLFENNILKKNGVKKMFTLRAPWKPQPKGHRHSANLR